MEPCMNPLAAILVLVGSVSVPWVLSPGVRTSACAADTSPVGAKSPSDGLEFRGRVVGPEGKPVSMARLFLIPSLGAAEMVYGMTATPPVPKVRSTTRPDGTFQFVAARSEFGDPESSPAWGMSGLVAVAEGLGIGWGPVGAFDSSGAILRGVLKQHPEAAIMVAFKLKPVLTLVKDDVPLAGRVVSTGGKPVAGATVSAFEIWAFKNDDLSGFLSAVVKSWDDYDKARGDHVRDMLPPSHQLRHVLRASTDREGKFCLRGIGRERVARVVIEGPAIRPGMVYARTRQGPTLQVPHEYAGGDDQFTFQGATFEHRASVSVPIVGVVRDKDTGQAVPGVTIQSHKFAESLFAGTFMDLARVVTDREGRYRLEGMPIGEDNQILVVGPADQPYLPSVKRIDIPAGEKTLQVDLELKRGVWIRGSVIDGESGRPVMAHVQYFALVANPHHKSAPGFAGAYLRPSLYLTNTNGCYCVPGLPGRGIVGVYASGDDARYPRGSGEWAIQGSGDRRGAWRTLFAAYPVNCNPFTFHAVAEVNMAEGAEILVQDFRLDSGQTLHGTVLDPEGRPLAGAWFRGLTAWSWWAGPLASEKFLVNCYLPQQARTLLFVHKERKLAGSRILKGAQPGPLTIQLQPWGVITGRVVDAEGKPRAKALLVEDRAVSRTADKGYPPEPYYFTDENGRFRIEGLAAGVKYNLLIQEGKSPGQVVFEAAVEPGQTKDLGDLPIKPMPLPEP